TRELVGVVVKDVVTRSARKYGGAGVAGVGVGVGATGATLPPSIPEEQQVQKEGNEQGQTRPSTSSRTSNTKKSLDSGTLLRTLAPLTPPTTIPLGKGLRSFLLQSTTAPNSRTPSTSKPPAPTTPTGPTPITSTTQPKRLPHIHPNLFPLYVQFWETFLSEESPLQ
ncbi:hypothetical protein HK102_009863, partial [Quaeritorhiza haematococci]